MKRIAYASPVNPAPSGISDYSEELLPFLGQYADMTLYVANGLKPTNRAMLRELAVRPLSQLARDQRQRPYDAIVYHIGNSPLHADIWTALQRVPGVVVLHEHVLNHFMLNYAAVTRRDVAAYETEALRRYGAEGGRVAQLMMRGRLTEAAFEYPFSEQVIEVAHGVIAHSKYVAERVHVARPDLPTAVVPMGVPLPPLIERDEARRQLGMGHEPLLASFGHINPYKRIEPVLRAIRLLRQRHAGLRYLLVGSVSANYDLHAAIQRYGLENVVTVTGYVDRATFEHYVAAADICLNLRHPTAGETSASLLRLLGAGRPTLVTASGSFTELPANVAAQVDPDASEGDLIVAYCDLLLTQPELAQALGANARAFVAREHTLEAAAQGYIRFLATCYNWGETPILRPPLWEEQKTVEGTVDGGRWTVARQHTTSEPQITEDNVLPVASEGGMTAVVAEALVSMGATEDDTALMQSAARALKDIEGA